MIVTEPQAYYTTLGTASPGLLILRGNDIFRAMQLTLVLC